MKQELLLIDGRNWVYRNGFTRTQLASRGRPTGVLFGCLSSLIRLNRLYPNAAIVVCWDGKHASKSWRHQLCPSYKSNRTKDKDKTVPVEVQNIRKQIPVLERFLEDFGLRQFTVPFLEADDLIGVLATAFKKTHHKVLIYSTDRDFFQLIKDNVAVVRDIDKAKKGIEISAQQIEEEYGVHPKDWLKYRAFVGDPGDKIDKPIRGVGQSKALKILAAGVDASKKKPHPDYAQHWPAIRLAYNLSRIVKKFDDTRLPRKTQKHLRRIVEANSSNLFRRKEAISHKNFDRMIAFLNDYDLQDILERRMHLWRVK